MSNIRKIVVCIPTVDDLQEMRIGKFKIVDSTKAINLGHEWFYKVSKIKVGSLQAPKTIKKLTDYIMALKKVIEDGTVDCIGNYVTGEYWNKVIGACGLSNTASLNVYEIDSYGGYVIAAMNNFRPKRYRLYSNSKGSFFNWSGSRYYLDDFMRV